MAAEPSQSPGALAADLASYGRKRVAAALTALLQAMDSGQSVAIALPDANILDVFGDAVPDDVIETFQTLVAHYQMFEPTPSQKRRHEVMIECAVYYGHGRGALFPALAIQGSDRPADYARGAISLVCSLLYETEQHLVGAEMFISFLLDVAALRRIVVEQLADRAEYGLVDALIKRVLPMLSQAERSQFSSRIRSG